MNGETVESFFDKVLTIIDRHFTDYRVEILLKTPRSLKVKIHLTQRIFIAIRYNARNERVDFALVSDKERVFGYDNLKHWHYHPFKNPSEHIPCEKPSIEKMISEIKEIYILICK